MKRSIRCKEFLKINEVNCCSIINQDDESSFNPNGCDCCQSGYALNTYDCSGFNPKTRKIIELGYICHDCICYFYNGDDSEIEER